MFRLLVSFSKEEKSPCDQKETKQEKATKKGYLKIGYPCKNSLHCPNSKNAKAKIQPNRAQEEIP